MTEREKLIELINTFCKEELGTNFNKNILDMFADFLLASGVIVPPCKVGDRLYRIVDKPFSPGDAVARIDGDVEPFGVTYRSLFGHYCLIPFDEFGKTTFLTKEEAEKAIKERQR